MKLFFLNLLVLTVLLAACKQGKNTTNEKSSKDSSKSSTSTTGNWTIKDKDQFVDECVKKAAERLKTSDAISYCRCMQETLEQKYPESEKLTSLSNAEMETYRDDCLKKYNITGNTDPTGDDGTGTAGGSAWPSADVKVFMENCTPALVASMGQAKANDYCECMLQKIMVVAPESKDAGNISKETMSSWATDCLK